MLQRLGALTRFSFSSDFVYTDLQCVPSLACIHTIIQVSFILYAIQPTSGTVINHLTPQGGVIVIIASGMVGCLMALFVIPTLIRHLVIKPAYPTPVRHMNLLGLPDEVVQEIAYDKVVPSRLTRLHRFLFELDLNSSIRGCARLMALHSTAETFDQAAEALFKNLQVCLPGCHLVYMHIEEEEAVQISDNQQG